MKRSAWSPRTVTALRRGAAVVATLLAVLPAVLPAAAAEAPTRDEIYQELDVAEQAADYVVLVDTSGSMAAKGRYNTVRSTLRTFLDGLTPADHVALITFDNRPEARYIGPAGDADKIVSRLPKAPNPVGGTDIGAALNRAVSELERTDALGIASVVLLTDGKHEPPKGTAYPKSSGAPWDALRKRADAIGERTELAGYALPLGSGATGADLLGDVVRSTQVLRPDGIDDLGAYLQRAGDSTRARAAAQLLAEDKGKGVTASWTDTGVRDLTGGSATASVTFRSATRHVPLTVGKVRVSAAGVPLDVTGVPEQLTLKPGESQKYDVRLAEGPEGGGLPFHRTEDGDAALQVSGQVSSPWQRVLAPEVDLGVPDEVGVTGDPLAVRAEVGSVYFLPAVLLALVAVLGFGWLRWQSVHRPRLHGVLRAVPAFGKEIPERIVLSGRRVRLRPRGGGQGTVHGRRRRTADGPRVDLLIRYTPDGTSGRSNQVICGPGGQAVVGGLSFTHEPREPREPRESHESHELHESRESEGAQGSQGPYGLREAQKQQGPRHPYDPQASHESATDPDHDLDPAPGTLPGDVAPGTGRP